MQRAGEDYPTETIILASIADSTRYLLHSLGAKKGDPIPPSFVEALQRKQEKEEKGFKTAEEFEAARAAILKRKNNG